MTSQKFIRLAKVSLPLLLIGCFFTLLFDGKGLILSTLFPFVKTFEKVFATEFPQCTPPLLVSRSLKRLKDFLQEHQDVVYKPLNGMGGTSIFRVKSGDQNLNVILETLTKFGSETVMAQKYLPEISDGDKRVLIVDGEVIPFCLARIPSPSDFRGNLAAGGKGEVRPLTERDQWIADQVAPVLVERGLLFL